MKKLFIWRTEYEILLAYAKNKEEAKEVILGETKEIDPWTYGFSDPVGNLHEDTRKQIIRTLNNQEPFILITTKDTGDFAYIISHGNE